MEKDESQNIIETPSGRRNSLDGNEKCDEFSDDISRMLEKPPKHLGYHRRALSEIITLPDDISFDIDHNGPDEDLLFLDVDKFNSSSQTSQMQPPENDWSRVKHEHSASMDGCSIKPQMLISSDAKKSISDAKLALVDPKHAKRILANRQSAARSKERKMRYIAELERQIQMLQTEASACSAQLTLLQRDTNALTAENNELKLRLQTMKQQIHMQDAFNNALKEEIHHLKILTAQNLMNGGSTINFRLPIGPNHQFHPTNHAMNTHQFHQLQNQHPIQKQQLQQFHQIQNQHPFQEQQFHQFHQKHQQPSQQHPGHRSSLST